MNEIVLTGLDGSNPLAYLAALGALVGLENADERPSQLSWRLAGVWRPVLHTPLGNLEAVVAQLEQDRLRAAKDPAIHFTYDKKGKQHPDVKARPEELHASLQRWAAEARPDHRNSLDWFTAFVSEGALDNNGAAKPTALHFTAGNQTFLGMAVQLGEGVGPSELGQALAGPWTYDSKLPVMGWDNTEARDYALRASNPALDKKLGNPGADWLALRGLKLLTCTSVGGRQRTPGVEGRWKTARWAWPIWTPAIGLDTARALVMTRGLRRLSEQQRLRRGIAQVFEARIRRSDQGGYGSVTPSRVI